MSMPSSLPEPRAKVWWQPAVFDYSQLEAFVMRAAFAFLLFYSIKWETAPYKTQRNPTGLAHFFDFTWLAEHPPGPLWQGVCILSLVLYVLGLLPALTLAPTLASAIMIGTLVTSKAMHHSWQAVTLIALAQFLVYAWPRGRQLHRWVLGLILAAIAGLAFREISLLPGFAMAMKPFFSWLGHALNTLIHFTIIGFIVGFLASEINRAKSGLPAEAAPLRPGLPLHRIAIYASTVTFAASYVVCGIVKLVNSDFQWIQKVPYLSVQLLKSNWDGYYDSLVPVPEWLDKVTQGIVDHPHLARLIFGSGLFVELFAFVVLINRRWAFVGGLVIIAMHLSISKIMDLHFEYHMAAALILLMNVPGLMKTFGRASAC
ncbi:MAG: hypothetical protein JWO89_3643 [Verrucomicrobiaceae bacterium]|nr:hypothetical protein [Verrucomicrobiaceae bacterium]